MIRSLTVKNYRVFEEFFLDQAARVNLVVGTNNSQVFATTHSWDCVSAFQQALHEVTDPSTGRVIRLDRTDGPITAVGYAAHELDIAIKQGIEVR